MFCSFSTTPALCCFLSCLFALIFLVPWSVFATRLLSVGASHLHYSKRPLLYSDAVEKWNSFHLSSLRNHGLSFRFDYSQSSQFHLVTEKTNLYFSETQTRENDPRFVYDSFFWRFSVQLGPFDVDLSSPPANFDISYYGENNVTIPRVVRVSLARFVAHLISGGPRPIWGMNGLTRVCLLVDDFGMPAAIINSTYPYQSSSVNAHGCFSLRIGPDSVGPMAGSYGFIKRVDDAQKYTLQEGPGIGWNFDVEIRSVHDPEVVVMKQITESESQLEYSIQALEGETGDSFSFRTGFFGLVGSTFVLVGPRTQFIYGVGYLVLVVFDVCMGCLCCISAVVWLTTKPPECWTDSGIWSQLKDCCECCPCVRKRGIREPDGMASNNRPDQGRWRWNPGDGERVEAEEIVVNRDVQKVV